MGLLAVGLDIGDTVTDHSTSFLAVATATTGAA